MNDSSGYVGIGIGVIAVAAAVFFVPDVLERGFKKEMEKEGQKIQYIEVDYEERMAAHREKVERMYDKLEEQTTKQWRAFHNRPTPNAPFHDKRRPAHQSAAPRTSKTAATWQKSE